MGSQITNVLRCLYLEACGYQVTVTELVGWEHSMKNELIVARRTGKPKRRCFEESSSAKCHSISVLVVVLVLLCATCKLLQNYAFIYYLQRFVCNL
jgi:hypothetical protein